MCDGRRNGDSDAAVVGGTVGPIARSSLAHQVKAIGRRRLRTDVGDPGRRVVHQLVIEAFALFRRQRYGTVAACADTQRALWLRGNAAGGGRAYARRSVGGPFPATFRGISFVRADRQSCGSVEPGGS